MEYYVTSNDVADIVEELELEDVVIFSNPDYNDGLIGFSDDDRAIYDYNLMGKCLMSEDGMSEEEAVDFIEYNTMRALPYMPNRHIVLIRVVKEDVI